jgi:hypothetical protein
VGKTQFREERGEIPCLLKRAVLPTISVSDETGA